MKIGFDVSQTGRRKAGCGYLADCLIRHLALADNENEYILYPTFGDSYWDPLWPSETCDIFRPNFRRGLAHRSAEEARNFWHSSPANLESELGGPDVVHANNFFCPVGFRHARTVYTLYDLSFLECPDWSTEANRTACLKGVFNASIYADRIIAISQHTQNHFLRLFPHYPADRITVMYPASRFTQDTAGVAPAKLELTPRQFWLHVGTVEPRKNQKNLLEAYARLVAQCPAAFPLVLAGGRGWLMDDFDETISKLGLKDRVVECGYVPEETLRWLYENCFAFVYPSLFEGFGLPVLEAMGLGAPVIASRAASLPEIVGDAGLLIDPLKPDEIVHAMLRLTCDPCFRQQQVDAGRNRAKKFSWGRASQTALDVYRELGPPPS